jgi:hypothetical protein
VLFLVLRHLKQNPCSFGASYGTNVLSSAMLNMMSVMLSLRCYSTAEASELLVPLAVYLDGRNDRIMGKLSTRFRDPVRLTPEKGVSSIISSLTSTYSDIRVSAVFLVSAADTADVHLRRAPLMRQRSSSGLSSMSGIRHSIRAAPSYMAGAGARQWPSRDAAARRASRPSATVPAVPDYHHGGATSIDAGDSDDVTFRTLTMRDCESVVAHSGRLLEFDGPAGADAHVCFVNGRLDSIIARDGAIPFTTHEIVQLNFSSRRSPSQALGYLLRTKVLAMRCFGQLMNFRLNEQLDSLMAYFGKLSWRDVGEATSSHAAFGASDVPDHSMLGPSFAYAQFMQFPFSSSLVDAASSPLGVGAAPFVANLNGPSATIEEVHHDRVLHPPLPPVLARPSHIATILPLPRELIPSLIELTQYGDASLVACANELILRVYHGASEFCVAAKRVQLLVSASSIHTRERISSLLTELRSAIESHNNEGVSIQDNDVLAAALRTLTGMCVLKIDASGARLQTNTQKRRKKFEIDAKAIAQEAYWTAENRRIIRNENGIDVVLQVGHASS